MTGTAVAVAYHYTATPAPFGVRAFLYGATPPARGLLRKGVRGMTNEGKLYALGAMVIAVLGAVLLLWSVLVWIGLGVLAIAVVIVVWAVWGKVHQRRIEHRKAVAEAVKAEAEAEQAQALAEERRA